MQQVASSYTLETDRAPVPWLRGTDRPPQPEQLPPQPTPEPSSPYGRMRAEPTSNIAGEVERALSQALSRIRSEGTVIPRPFDVRGYLVRYPEMLEVAPAVCRAAARRFGTEAQLSLELYRDPEIEDEYLTLYIRQEPYEDDVMKRIEATWDECAEVIAGSSGWILVTTDFEPPVG